MSRQPVSKREVLEARGEGLAQVVAIDPADQADSELRIVRTELEDVAQAGIAGAGVVHGQAHLAELREGAPDAAVIVDPGVFGQLEHERPGRRPDDLAEPPVAMEHELGRDVQRQEQVAREARRVIERGTDRGGVPSSKRVSASKPTTVFVSSSTIGWKTGAAGIADPEPMAAEFQTLISGAISLAVSRRTTEGVIAARDAAMRLIALADAR